MSWQQFKHAWLIKFWAPIPAVIAAGIFTSLLFWHHWHILGSHG